LELVYFETLDQFNPSSFEIRGFCPFNQILLVYFMFRMHFRIVFELFILFDTFWLNVKSITIVKRI